MSCNKKYKHYALNKKLKSEVSNFNTAQGDENIDPVKSLHGIKAWCFQPMKSVSKLSKNIVSNIMMKPNNSISSLKI